MYRGPNPNEETAALHPRDGAVDAWSIGDRTDGAQAPDRSDSEKYLMWDGSSPLPLQLPDNAPIRTLVTYAATAQNISIFAGAGVTNGPPLLQTSGAAGTFRVPRGHNALTLLASAPFGQSIPIYICAVALNPTVALQQVNVTLNSGIPPGAVFTYASGNIVIAGPGGAGNLSFSPAIPGGAPFAITYADFAFDNGIVPGGAIILQQYVGSTLKGLLRLVNGRNAATWEPGLSFLTVPSITLFNAAVTVIGNLAGTLYYTVFGYHL